MKGIRESAEHHFLTTLEKLKPNPKGWVAMRFLLSRDLDHHHIINKPSAIKAHIERNRVRSDAFMTELVNRAFAFRNGYAYVFSDHDVLLLTRPETMEQKEELDRIFTTMKADLPAQHALKENLASDFYTYQKWMEQKLLSAKRFASYTAMSDENKVASIALRRERRNDPLIQVIEDDRFTAAYASNILSREYDLVVSRNGEDGIIAYIEHAPDIVFLDIHLPGLSGHDTLEAIQAIDPSAYVVMLSVDTAKTNIVQASHNGARNFLKKPFSKERLLHSVRTSPYIRECLQKQAIGQAETLV